MVSTQTIPKPEVVLFDLGGDLEEKIDDRIDKFCVSLHNDSSGDAYWEEFNSKKQENIKGKEFWHSNLKLYVHSFPQIKVLSLEEELRLGKEKKISKRAEEDLVFYNLSLVIKIAKQYHPEKIDLLDLIQEGNIALIRCSRVYKPRFNKKLSHLAGKAINNAILNEIKWTDRTIRLPNWVCEFIGKLIRAENRFIEQNFRKPTYSELADEMGVSEKRLKRLIKYDTNCDSLDREIRSGKDIVPKYNFVKDKKIGTEDAAIRLNLRSEIDRLLSKNLSEKYADVIKLRFGLNDDVPRTLDEIKVIYNITRERTRQIVSRALEKLRDAPFIEDFLVYLYD